MRTMLHLPLDVATAFFFAASVGIGAGIAATSYTHRLGDGLRAALIGFLVAAAGFGYVLWRNYRPRSKTAIRRLRTA